MSTVLAQTEQSPPIADRPLPPLTMKDTGLVPDFVRILRREPPWTEAFLYTAATSGFGTKNLDRLRWTATGAESKNRPQPAPALALTNSSNPGVHAGVHQTGHRKTEICSFTPQTNRAAERHYPTLLPL